MRQLVAYLLISLLTNSCQTSNSNAFDDIYGTSDIDPTNTNLVNAFEVIEDSCINCHSGYHSDWAYNTTDNDWINSGTVVAGDIDSSTLITRLKNRGSDMPKDQAALTDEEYNTLVTWIEGLE